MTTSEEALNQYNQLHSQLEELHNEFSLLGQALRETATDIDTHGLPPEPEEIRTAVETLASDFEKLHAQILEYTAAVTGKELEETPRSLGELNQTLDDAFQALLQRERRRRLAPLEKASVLTRTEGKPLHQLKAFRAEARTLFKQLESLENGAFEEAFQKEEDRLSAYSALAELIEQGEQLSDQQCETLRQTAAAAFDNTLVIAALRGHLAFEKTPLTPEIPELLDEDGEEQKSPSSSPQTAPSTAPQKLHPYNPSPKPHHKKNLHPEPSNETDTEESKEPKQSSKFAFIKNRRTVPSLPQPRPKTAVPPKQEIPVQPLPQNIPSNFAPAQPAVESEKSKLAPTPEPEAALPEKKAPVAEHSLSEVTLELEECLEKTSFHEIIMSSISREKLHEHLDFSRLNKAQAEASAQAIQDWVAMSRDLKATSQEIRSVLNTLGFEVLDISKEQRKRVCFLAHCRGIPHLIMPKGFESASAETQYRIACYWGRPSEETLLEETPENGHPALVFHFGCLTDERRLDLSKLCREHQKHLLILDDLLAMHILSLPEEKRLEVLFAGVLPIAYADKLNGEPAQKSSSSYASVS